MLHFNQCWIKTEHIKFEPFVHEPTPIGSHRPDEQVRSKEASRGTNSRHISRRLVVTWLAVFFSFCEWVFGLKLCWMQVTAMQYKWTSSHHRNPCGEDGNFTQKVIATSSGEAQYHSMAKLGSAIQVSLRFEVKGISLRSEVCVESSTSLHITVSQLAGTGSM